MFLWQISKRSLFAFSVLLLAKLLFYYCCLPAEKTCTGSAALSKVFLPSLAARLGNGKNIHTIPVLEYNACVIHAP